MIHFNEKYLEKLVEPFKKKSETEDLFSHELDMQFSGNKTVHVKSLKSVPLNDYDRSANITSASRYGVPVEVEDFEQTFTMTKDRSNILTVDKGNEQESGLLKAAGKVMATQTEEIITPEIDTYRFAKWAAEAGIHKGIAEPTTSTIVKAIIDLHNEMIDAGVPEDGVRCLVKRKYLPAIKMSSEFLALDSLGGKVLPRGTVGELDGMPVKPVSSNKMPDDVYFILLYKGSVISPVRFKEFKVDNNNISLSGTAIAYRMMYDAFVLGHKANGVAVACASASVVAAPRISKSGSTATITAVSGVTFKYTLDGSDPRYSVDAVTYTEGVAVPAGAKFRAFGAKDGMFNSEVAEMQF